VVALVLSTLLASIGTVTAASPADAFTVCLGWKSWTWTHDDGVARFVGKVSRDCLGGGVHMSGYIEDNLCDNRSAFARIEFLGIYPYGHVQPPNVKAGGGCGTRQSFNVSSGDRNASIRVTLWADSSSIYDRGSDEDTRTSPV
jgi:hypothetical protein